MILIIPVKAYHYVNINRSYGGFGGAPATFTTYDKKVEFKINCKLLDMQTGEILLDYNSISDFYDKKDVFSTIGDKSAKNIVDFLNFLTYKPDIRKMILKFIDSYDLEINIFLDFCRIKNLPVEETRLDYIVDNDIYIPKSKDGVTYISDHWKLEELFPKIEFSKDDKDKKKEYKIPEKDIIFDISR